MLKIFISDNLEASWLETNEKYKLADFFNRKIFRVSDSSLTYRQINNLEESGLFSSGRMEDSQWRKLSFKEIIYMELVNELRRFGFKNNQLTGLRDIFFGGKDMDTDSEEYKDLSLFTSDLIIGLCFGSGVEVILSMDADGEGGFFDINSYFLFQAKEKSQVILNINDFINNILIKIDKKPFLVKYGLKDMPFIGKVLSKKEEDLISKIRDGQSKSIRVEMKKGEPNLVYLSSEIQGNFNIEEVEKQIEESNFQDIRIIKRDGKIVNIKKQQVVKLNSTEQKK